MINTTDYDLDTEEIIMENNFNQYMENIKINDETINVDIENNEYIDPNKSDIKIPDITQYISNTLDINNEELNESVLTTIQKKKLKINNSNKHNYVNHINNILNNNNRLDKLEKIVKNDLLKNNIISLKKKMGKVQILSLLKDKQDNKEFNILLNDVISTFSNKVDKINNVLEYNLTQTGGNSNIVDNSNIYYYKYLKYKIKYLTLLLD